MLCQRPRILSQAGFKILAEIIWGIIRSITRWIVGDKILVPSLRNWWQILNTKTVSPTSINQIFIKYGWNLTFLNVGGPESKRPWKMMVSILEWGWSSPDGMVTPSYSSIRPPTFKIVYKSAQFQDLSIYRPFTFTFTLKTVHFSIPVKILKP